MRSNNTIFGLPRLSLNLLSTGCFWLMICLGVRIIRGSDLALQIADTQLTVANSAESLSTVAKELDAQAELIKQKDKAYQELNLVYERSLKEAEGYEKLKSKIEVIKELPQVENIDDLQEDIFATESDLLEITNE
jgi:hypothetical protein